MSTPSLAQVIEQVETLYPLAFAEDWDRVGLVVGDPQAPVSSVLLAVDPTVAVARDARDANLLITHHPLLLRGASFLPVTSGKGAVVSELIGHGTALWCGHTNADRAVTGTAPALARAIGLTGATALVPPAEGRGSDERLLGLGVVGDLEPTTVGELADRLAQALPATVQGAKHTGDPDRPVRRAAICPGAGDSELETAARSGADVYITSDLRHHPALEHLESRADPLAVPALIDVPHYACEAMWLPLLAQQLEDIAAREQWDLSVRIDERSTDVWTAGATRR